MNYLVLIIKSTGALHDANNPIIKNELNNKFTNEVISKIKYFIDICSLNNWEALDERFLNEVKETFLTVLNLASIKKFHKTFIIFHLNSDLARNSVAFLNDLIDNNRLLFALSRNPNNSIQNTFNFNSNLPPNKMCLGHINNDQLKRLNFKCFYTADKLTTQILIFYDINLSKKEYPYELQEYEVYPYQELKTSIDIFYNKMCCPPFQSDNNSFHKVVYYKSDNFLPYNESYDPRYLIYDCSIWNRVFCSYVSNFQSEEDFKKELELNNRWFELDSSKEYRKFLQRLFKQSFIESNKVLHNKYVTPFKFHSESMCWFWAEETKKKIISLLSETNISWKWRILIADDCAENGLCISDDNLSKLLRIKEVLNIDDNNNLKLDENSSLKFEIKTCKKLIEFESLNLEEFDFILIDYLFEENEKGSLIYKNCIQQLYNISSNQDNKSGFKHWLIPISAYNFAFLDHLKLMGISFLNNNTFISEGGDPICTPNLFKHKFFEFLYLKLKENIIQYENEIFSIKVLIQKLQISRDKNELIMTAKRLLPTYLKYYDFYFKNKTVKNTSLFSNSIFQLHYSEIFDEGQEPFLNILLEILNLLSVPSVNHDVFSDILNQVNGLFKAHYENLNKIYTIYYN